MRFCTSFVVVAAFALHVHCQTLRPVNISDFKKGGVLEATVTGMSTVECSGSDYFKAGALHHDNLSYDVHLSAQISIENRSQQAILLYRDFDPALVERVAKSPMDLRSGKFVGGFDGDRIAIIHEPKKVSFEDFVIITAGGSYKTAISTRIFASKDPAKPLHSPGTYWVQLVMDARPDDFYFSPSSEADFRKTWGSRGRLVGFIVTKPFSVDIALDSNAPPCISAF